MRGQIDSLSEKIMDSDFLKKNDFVEKETKSLKAIRSNLGSYMRKRYQVFEDADYTPTEQVIRIARQGFKGDKEAVRKY